MTFKSGKYRALFTADWQLCNSLPHARVVDNGETDRLLDQKAVIKKIGEIALEQRVDDIFILGDIYERRLLDAVTLRAGIEAVLELSKIARVHLLPGNHDVNSSTGERDLLEPFAEILDNSMAHLSKYAVYQVVESEVAFYPIPWLPLSAARKRLEELRGQSLKYGMNVLLIHQGINGCKDGGWVCENELDEEEVCKGWDLVLAGHFHDRQTFGGNGEYVGAPMQHDFRDAGAPERGVLLVEFDSPLAKKIFVPIESPRFFTLDWRDTDDPRKSTSRRSINSGDYLRIDIEATSQEYESILPEVESFSRLLRETGVHVMPPKHLPVSQVESRLGATKQSTPSFEEAIARYVGLSKTDPLDPKRLIETAMSILREVENG